MAPDGTISAQDAQTDDAPRPFAPPLWRSLALPLLVLLAGVGLIAAMGALESVALSEQVWRDAVFAPEGEPPWEDTLPIRVRHVPDENLFARHPILEEIRRMPDGKELLARAGLDKMEYVVALRLPEEEWERLLDLGRLPEPGKPEVLAGDLARFDEFVMDGVTFTVTGRLQRGVSGFAFAYALPHHESNHDHFSARAGATVGWLHPEGLARIDAGDFPEEIGQEFKLVGGAPRTTDGVAAGTIAGMMLVALGGVMVQVRLLKWLNRKHPTHFAVVLREIARRPRLFASVHLVLFGAFFVLMTVALAFPLMNLRLVHAVREEFSSGGLSYIGDAYASQNVLKATAATFFHNFVVATVGFSVIPSLLIPFAGLLKNLASFTIVGFVMAPLWTGSAQGLVYHSITMVLELEAYALTSFIVTVLPIRGFKGLLEGEFVAQYAAGVRIIISGALLAGAMLAVAAVYEATTLILLN